MADEAVAPIIIKKKVVNAAGHHGGAWKIAYADFVTAMMAFFLLMWLINATSPDQKTGIANFFTPSNARPSGSGAGGILGGTSIMSEGMTRGAGTPADIVISLPSTNADRMGGPAEGQYSGSNVTEILNSLLEDGVDIMRYPEILADLARQTDAREVLRALEAEGVDVLTHPEILDEIFEVAATTPPDDLPEGETPPEETLSPAAIMEQALAGLTEEDLADLSPEEIAELTDAFIAEMATAGERQAQAALEQAQFAQVEETIRQSIESIPELEPYRDNLRIDITPEGLRIQIVDQENQAMFPSGSAALHEQTRALVDIIARVVKAMPNDIMITGHTDARPFQNGGGYGNWELSSDRANAARRALIEAGFPEERIARVVGRADRDPLVSDDPLDPINRRITFVVLSSVPNPDGTTDHGGPAIEGEVAVEG